MVTVLTTQAFDVWFAALADKQAKVRIQVRIDRLERGSNEHGKSEAP
jgi:putative component of toxin-antitoxin plasmid stabilization module